MPPPHPDPVIRASTLSEPIRPAINPDPILPRFSFHPPTPSSTGPSVLSNLAEMAAMLARGQTMKESSPLIPIARKRQMNERFLTIRPLLLVIVPLFLTNVFCVKAIGNKYNSRKRTILRAIVDRWWDTTHTFHFDEFGEMTTSDFSPITGLPIFGKSLEYNVDAYKNKDELVRWFGEPMANIAKKKVLFLEIYDAYKGFGGNNIRVEDKERLTRVFILTLLSGKLMCDKAGVVNLYYMTSLRDISSIGLYNWGGAGLSTLYKKYGCCCEKESKHRWILEGLRACLGL
ncbi:hypothetical protein Dsin_028814 [Dipteronia sinensis]|uniref:Aminotransferase-like plant mobile domain-containing protein n=1 Tax=Dipteronia sinensis TaxID=43782 RepID=A0AAD9ZR51_9ROSI|nr:hypothetical protein Dsin_028814 [Dipteronia sinensis]